MKNILILISLVLTLIGCQTTSSNTSYNSNQASTFSLKKNFYVKVDDFNYDIHNYPELDLGEKSLNLWKSDDTMLGFMIAAFDQNEMIKSFSMDVLIAAFKSVIQSDGDYESVAFKERTSFTHPKGLEMKSYRLTYYNFDNSITTQIVYFTKKDDIFFTSIFTLPDNDYITEGSGRMDKIMKTAYFR